jgi:hypothetical protein
MGSWFSAIQHWINATFHIGDLQSAPIITTLLVFIVGGLAKSTSKLLKNLSARYAIRKQFYSIMDNIASGANFMAITFKNIEENLMPEGLKAVENNGPRVFQHKVLNDIGYKEILDSLFSGVENWVFWRRWSRRKKIAAFQQSWELAAGIPYWQDIANEDIVKTIDYFNSRQEKINVELSNFQRTFYTVAKSIAGNPTSDYARDLLKEIMQVKLKWAAMENFTSPKNTLEHFIRPVLEMTATSQWDGAIEIRFPLLEAQTHCQNIEKLIHTKKIQFSKYAQYMSDSATSIKKYKIIIRRYF